jgi:hypothetical protein
VPKVLVPLNDQLGCDLKQVVREAVKAGREDAVNALKGELERLRGEVRELALAASRKAEKRPVNRVIEDWKAVGGGGGY